MKQLTFLLILLIVFSNSSFCQEKIDGVEKATPIAEKLLTEQYDTLLERIRKGDFGKLNSLIVIYNDKLITEEYFNGWTSNKLHWIASDVKSVTSVLTGIAIEKGYIKSVNERIFTYLSNYKNVQNYDTLKKQITIENLLTMSSGLKWIEWDDKNPNLDIGGMFNSKNWVNYVLNQPMVCIPGNKFNYNSGSTNVLGELLKNATGQDVRRFAKKYLFKPLNIKSYYWENKNGITNTGGGLFLKPIDLAKIGYLCLKKGKYSGNQILSSNWISESFQNKMPIGQNLSYGYLWYTWDSYLDFDDIVYAAGHAGQYIYIINEFNTVISVTADNPKPEDSKFTHLDMLFDYLSLLPEYQKKIYNIYDKIILKGVGQYKSNEILSLVYTLIEYKDYQLALNVLKMLTYMDNDYFYQFLYGKASFYTGDIVNARLHLEKHIDLNKRKTIHEQAFFDMTQNLLNKLNN